MVRFFNKLVAHIPILSICSPFLTTTSSTPSTRQQHRSLAGAPPSMAAAGPSTPVTPQVIGSTGIEISRNNRTIAPFCVRISARSNGVVSSRVSTTSSEGPSCIFVGPVETASKETLEALYRQARQAYYSGTPLIVDDMFDRIELKLRWYGSKDVVKYPRCSLRRQSTYADAEEDPSQVFTLASVWLLFLGFGSSACLMPLVYTINHAYENAFSSGFPYSTQALGVESLAMLNGILFMALGSAIGYTSVGALQNLWRNDLIALKGVCPNCGEEVFAFVRSGQSNNLPHRADCHVCDSSLEFRTKVEESNSSARKRWVHGRIYLTKNRGRNQRQRWM